MAANINTAEIRRSARALQACARRAKSDLLSSVRKTLDNVDQAVEGEAAAALTDRLESITGDIRRSYQHLSAAAESMFKYADKLDEIDAATKNMINSK